MKHAHERNFFFPTAVSLISKQFRPALPMAAAGVFLLGSAAAYAQSGTVTGEVTDSAGGRLQGARVDLEPGAHIATSDANGAFRLQNLAPGAYKVTISFVGFSAYSGNVTVTGSQVANLVAALNVASDTEQVLVSAGRAHGEAEAINQELTAENILQVLPHDVITSLPNANVADAIGRLPSVTLERDEGEGKYVQVRGTEPRFTNVTVDGVNLASPENVRQIKLDVIPADLVDAVTISKTLVASQDGDSIGGSVNLRTKTAGERPTVEAFGQGGYTPIINGRTESQFGITLGKRFGADHKLGVIGGFTYDFNGRGIDDVEPVPVANQLDASGTNFAPSYSQADIREYRYYRDRFGFAGSFDYKISDTNNVYAKLLYSHFNNYGDRWDYNLASDSQGSADGTSVTPAPGGNGDVSFDHISTDRATDPNGAPGGVTFGIDIRRPVQVVGSLAVGGNKFFNNATLNYEVAASRAATDNQGYLNSQFNNPDQNAPINNVNFGVNTGRPLVPQFPVQNGVNIYDPSQYSMTNADVDYSYDAQVNLQAGAGYLQNYTVGEHHGVLEFGGKFRNVHKFSDSNDQIYNIAGTVPFTQFPDSFRNNHYYNGGDYQFGPVVNMAAARKYILSQPAGVLEIDPVQTAIQNAGGNFSLDERVSAGYVSNSITWKKFELYTGLRIEATNERLEGNVADFTQQDANGVPLITNQVSHPSYIDVLPTAQLRYTLPYSNNSSLRFVYGRGFSRPDYQDLPPSLTVARGGKPIISAGNPNLKPTHSNAYDLLYETDLKPFGLFSAGIFYKDLTSPIYATQRYLTSSDPLFATYGADRFDQSINGTSAWLWGFEVAYEQKFSMLPGLLSGLGFSGNYSYTDSLARGVPLRTDQPHLLRQAPNTFNVSPTYDKGPLSVRLGLTYNQAYIDFYQYQNELLNADNTVSPSPVPLGIKGPNGDNYFYTHTQLDLQGSYHVKGPISVYAYGLNLNNEVFGFYNGNPNNVVQREFYQPTVAAGVRFNLDAGK